MNDSPWMNGTQANSQKAAQGAVTDMVVSIFGAIGANRYATDHRFKHEDVVIEETARDNHALIVSGASLLLLIVVLIILLK